MKALNKVNNEYQDLLDFGKNVFKELTNKELIQADSGLEKLINKWKTSQD